MGSCCLISSGKQLSIIHFIGGSALQWYLDELPQLSKHLWAATNDPDDEVRFCAAGILLKAPLSADDAPKVIALLDNEHKYVRIFAMRVMGNWGYFETHAADMDKAQLLTAVPHLFELVSDDDSHTAAQATSVLRFLGPLIPEQLDRTLDLLNYGDLELEDRATSILRGMGPAAISALPQLVERLEADPTIRESGYFFHHSLAQAILAIDPSLMDMVVLKIARNLGQRGEDGFWETRLLCSLGTDASAAIPILKSYQVGEVDDVYLNATQALSNIAPDDPEVIAELLKVMLVVEQYYLYWVIDGLGRATTNFELARPGLEFVLGTDNEKNRERAQAILDLHPLPAA